MLHSSGYPIGHHDDRFKLVSAPLRPDRLVCCGWGSFRDPIAARLVAVGAFLVDELPPLVPVAEAEPTAFGDAFPMLSGYPPEAVVFDAANPSLAGETDDRAVAEDEHVYGLVVPPNDADRGGGRLSGDQLMPFGNGADGVGKQLPKVAALVPQPVRNLPAQDFGNPSPVALGRRGLGGSVEYHDSVRKREDPVLTRAVRAWSLRSADGYWCTRGGHSSSLRVTVSPSWSLMTTMENGRVPTWA